MAGWGKQITVNVESDKVKAAIAQTDSGSALFFLYENDKFLFVTDDSCKVDTTVKFMESLTLAVYMSENQKSERIF